MPQFFRTAENKNKNKQITQNQQESLFKERTGRKTHHKFYLIKRAKRGITGSSKDTKTNAFYCFYGAKTALFEIMLDTCKTAIVSAP